MIDLHRICLEPLWFRILVSLTILFGHVACFLLWRQV